MRKRILGTLFAVALIAGVPSLASAADISIYSVPDNTYQNGENDPCVFYGPGNCAPDPAGWPTPAGDTEGAFTTLTQGYFGADYTSWVNTVGTSFVLGLDINDTGVDETLNPFTITFLDASNATLASYSLAAPTSVPNGSNGVGYADYVLAAGCTGTTSIGYIAGFDQCSEFTPFVAPLGTAGIAFTFGFNNASNSSDPDGNDGPDKVFAINLNATTTGQTTGGIETASVVPEPTTLALLGTGLLFAARGIRRRARKSKA